LRLAETARIDDPRQIAESDGRTRSELLAYSLVRRSLSLYASKTGYLVWEGGGTHVLCAGYHEDCRDRMTRRPARSGNDDGIRSGGGGPGREDCEGGCAGGVAW